ncbi:serine hydrolase [Oscillatoria sp. FACHB-1406]|uniref:serine hydrolase n=1 Tax=Oscillatoria sp. FACHB-1406 TaxID=2692846 RepID=UPI00168A252B|nr:serine hydrolase [Oscillatoria sp. FACHB-1406]MBD2577748.1 serine hydrolase [Oscillatoria sp. FACHB-1406]
MRRLNKIGSNQKQPLKSASRPVQRAKTAPKSPTLATLPPKRRPSSAVARFQQRRSQSSRPRLPKIDTVVPKSSSPAASKPNLAKLPLYLVRLLIVGIGVGAISGTLISATNKSYLSQSANAKAEKVAAAPVRPPALLLKQESPELKSQIQTLLAKSPDFHAGVLLADLDTGVYLNLDGGTTFAAASTIKLPILVAFFQDVDAGKVSLEEKLTMTEATIAGEAGNMQYKEPGTQFSALETVTQMITVSDNTATNMIIERLGGAEVLNQRFRAWGLSSTAIQNYLPDVEGTNTTSPVDLAKVLAKLERGELVSAASRDRILEMMRNVITRDLLPRGLDEGATIAHKTGNIGSLVADAGAIETPTGKRYLAVVMVQRPHNDIKAKQLIRDISRSAYQYFNRSIATPVSTPTPNITETPAKSSEEMAAEE